MARTFENPVNRHREVVNGWTSLYAFLFGMLYFIYKGLWNHVLVWFTIVALPSFVIPFIWVLTLPVVSICYAIGIRKILATRYLSRGWREISGTASTASAAQVAVVPAASTAPVVEGVKRCPYCAEEVKAAATKCKHCQSDLPIVEAPVDTGSPHIKHYNGLYMVGGYNFDRLDEAQKCLADWVGPKP